MELCPPQIRVRQLSRSIIYTKNYELGIDEGYCWNHIRDVWAGRWYLSKHNGRLSFEECDDDQKTELVGKRATNNSAESSFSFFTQQLVTYNMIDLHAAGGTSDVKRNRYLF